MEKTTTREKAEKENAAINKVIIKSALDLLGNVRPVTMDDEQSYKFMDIYRQLKNLSDNI